jgi:hypothetical protein
MTARSTLLSSTASTCSRTTSSAPVVVVTGTALAGIAGTGDGAGAAIVLFRGSDNSQATE